MRTSHSLFLLLLATVLIVFSGCKKDEETNEIWTIPSDNVQDGGPGKDGIPSLQNPAFTDPSQATYLSDDDLVLGYVSGNSVKAYPHPILDWHEIINDQINGEAISVIYCPLTGTGMNWSSVIDGMTTEFGVSGLLFNSNVIPYDRATDSNWSQLQIECVNGTLLGTKPEVLELIETTWSTWKAMYPSTLVVSEETGFDRNYDLYPYGDYITNHSNIIFPVSHTDNRLPSKERVHAVVVNQNVKAYSFNAFGDTITVIEDQFNNMDLVIAGSKADNLVVSFNRTLNDGTVLSFSPVQDELPVILQDDEGTKWDVFGNGVEGPREGENLQTVTSLMGYWFSFAAFYPSLELYE